MKHGLILFIYFMSLSSMALFASSSEKFKELDSLVTIKGREYVKVTIRELNPSGIKIFHEAGVASIPFEDLSQELQESLGGFDPELAKTFREEANRSKQKRAIAHAKSLAEEAELARQEKEKERQNAIFEKSKVPTRLVIRQMHEGGALCEVSIRTLQLVRRKTPRALGGYDTKVEERWVWSIFSEDLFFVSGLPNHIVDNDYWECWTVGAENYSYTNQIGESSTVRGLEVVSPPRK